MRLSLAVLLIASALVGGCSRAHTFSAEPELAPRPYGQDQYAEEPGNPPADANSALPSSSGYDERTPSHKPPSRERAPAPVPRTDSKHRYLIQEA